MLTESDRIIDRGEYNNNLIYNRGDYVCLSKDNSRRDFVAKKEVPIGIMPPNEDYWIENKDIKTVVGCAARWKLINGGRLPFSGFPGIKTIK